MKIQVKTLTGKAITVNAELTDTIGVIKRKMAEIEHIPPDQHNLMFAGEQLQDWHTLADYIEFVKRDKPLPKHYQTYDAVATQANHGFVFKKRTIKQVIKEERQAEMKAATLRLQSATRGMLGRKEARKEFDVKMQQVDAATRVQSVVRRRLDKHKIDDLIQQKRVEEIIAEKEREELEQREQMDQNAERQSIFDMILTPFGTGSGSGDGDEMDGHAIRRAKEKRVAFVDLKKTDIPPDGKFWGSGYFVYWSDKHNRPYFYNPEMDETQWFPPDENREDDDDIDAFSDEEEDMTEGEIIELRAALTKARLKRLVPSEQKKFRDVLVVFREAVRKADVLDTGYLSESLMNKLAKNTGAVPECEQQFFLALKTCSRNHHGDLNHEDFNECFKITLGYHKLSFEQRLENNTAIKEMHSALARADTRFSGLLPEGTIRRIGVEYGVHKMRIELAMIVSARGLGDLVKYEECLPNLQLIVTGYRPVFASAEEEAKRARERAEAETAAAAASADGDGTGSNDLVSGLRSSFVDGLASFGSALGVVPAPKPEKRSSVPIRDGSDGYEVTFSTTLMELQPMEFTTEKQLAYRGEVAASLSVGAARVSIVEFAAGSVIVSTVVNGFKTEPAADLLAKKIKSMDKTGLVRSDTFGRYTLSRFEVQVQKSSTPLSTKRAANSGADDEYDFAAVNDANVIADAVKRQAEHEEMAGAACIIQNKFRQKAAMNNFYSKMCSIYMKRRMKVRNDPQRKMVSMQIMGGDPDSLETYKVVFEKEEPLRMVLKGVANRDNDTGIVHDFVLVTGFTRKANGAMGPAELVGDIGLMDFLVGVQDEQLVGLTFNEVMDHLRGVEYPLKLQFIKNRNMVPPDFEGWAQSYFPDFGDAEFHDEVRKKVKQTTVFQKYPDELSTAQLKRHYMELRGSELSFYRPAKGGAIQAIRSGFMETSDVQKVRRIKCWDAPENQRFQVWFTMKFAGGEHVKFSFRDERSVDEWAVKVGQMADVTPSDWEHLGEDPDQEYTEEVVEVKLPDEIVVLKGDVPKHGLQPRERCKVNNIDTLKKIVYVARLSDNREFGPFRHDELMEAPEDFQIEVPEDGWLRGSVLGYTKKMMNSEYEQLLARQAADEARKGNVSAQAEASGALSSASISKTGAASIFGSVGDALASTMRRKFYFAPSERVLVLRFGNLWYNATVTAVNEDDGSYAVDYEDGDAEARVEAARIMTFKGYEYEVDDPVEVHRFGRKWYKAVVEGKNVGRPGTDPTYDVRYLDNDDLELMVQISRMRVATGFVYNENALRKLVPNKPRVLSGGGSKSGLDGAAMSEIQKLQMQLHRLSGGRFGPDPAYHSERTTTTGGGWTEPTHKNGIGRFNKPGKPVKGAPGGSNSLKFDKADKSKSTTSGAKKKSGTTDRELGVQPLTKFDPGAGKQGKRASKIAKSKEGKKPPKEKNVIHGIKLGSKFQKHFEGHGTFVGTVVSYSKEKKYFSVKYTDGDTEELATDDLRALMGMPPRAKK